MSEAIYGQVQFNCVRFGERATPTVPLPPVFLLPIEVIITQVSKAELDFVRRARTEVTFTRVY